MIVLLLLFQLANSLHFPEHDIILEKMRLQKEECGLNHGKWTGASKYPIIELTCEKKYKWFNPFTNVTYTVPDQIPEGLVIMQGGSSNELYTTIYKKVLTNLRV